VKAIHQRRNLEYEKQIELSQAEFNQKMDEYTSKVWVSPNFLPTVGLRPPFGRKFHIHKISSLVIIFLPVCVYFMVAAMFLVFIFLCWVIKQNANRS